METHWNATSDVQTVVSYPYGDLVLGADEGTFEREDLSSTPAAAQVQEQRNLTMI
jgi:hypothetical protein